MWFSIYHFGLEHPIFLYCYCFYSIVYNSEEKNIHEHFIKSLLSLTKEWLVDLFCSYSMKRTSTINCHVRNTGQKCNQYCHYLNSLKCVIDSYFFVTIFFPLTNFVEVEVDLKLPPPAGPLNEELERDVKLEPIIFLHINHVLCTIFLPKIHHTLSI